MINPEQLAASGTEHGAQTALFCWAALPDVRAKYPQLRYMYAIPNGFFGSAAQKGKMKAEGLKSGVPDICLPIVFVGNDNRLIHAGLYIELKVGKGKTSKEQDDWISHLVEQGYACYVAYGWKDARDLIVAYLEG